MLRKDSKFPYLVSTDPREQVLSLGREDYTASAPTLRLSTDEEVAKYFPIRGVQLRILCLQQLQLRRRRYMLLVGKFARGKTRYMLHLPRRNSYFSDGREESARF